MKRYEVTMHPGGRITIPAAIRRKHSLQPGDTVIWFEQDGELCFRKVRPGERTDNAGTGDTASSDLSEEKET